jgi:hypothetical protein
MIATPFAAVDVVAGVLKALLHSFMETAVDGVTTGPLEAMAATALASPSTRYFRGSITAGTLALECVNAGMALEVFGDIATPIFDSTLASRLDCTHLTALATARIKEEQVHPSNRPTTQPTTVNLVPTIPARRWALYELQATGIWAA